jgi:cell division transport system permease protein
VILKINPIIYMFVTTIKLKTAFNRTASNVLCSPISTLMTVFSSTLLLILISMILVLSNYYHSDFKKYIENISISIFLKDNVKIEDVKLMQKKISEEKIFSNFSYISKNAALREFSSTFEKNIDPETVIYNKVNPLPASFEISIDVTDNNISELNFIIEKFSKYPQVELIQNDSYLSKILINSNKMFKFCFGVIIPFICIIIGFVIWSTLNLALQQHQKEIKILQLVGASNMYITLPYLLEALFYGMFGATFGYLIVLIITNLLVSWFPYLINIDLFSWKIYLQLIIIGTVTGVFSSITAVKMFLKNDN